MNLTLLWRTYVVANRDRVGDVLQDSPVIKESNMLRVLIALTFLYLTVGGAYAQSNTGIGKQKTCTTYCTGTGSGRVCTTTCN